VVVDGYDAINGKVLAVCGKYMEPSQFGNRVAVWGSISASNTFYSASVESITCDRTATLSFTSANESEMFTLRYALRELQSAERAIVGHEGVTVISQFNNFADKLTSNANCIDFYRCSGMPTGTRTNDVLGNTYYDGQLLIICEATYNDITLSETFTQGSATAKLVRWFER
jgi:hypothetical protein